MLLDLILTIALAVIVIGMLLPHLTQHPCTPLPARWVGTRTAREELAAARARLDAVTTADRAAGITTETDAYTEANTGVLDAEAALRASRHTARTEARR